MRKVLLTLLLLALRWEGLFCFRRGTDLQGTLCPQEPLRQYWDGGCRTCTDCLSLGQSVKRRCGDFEDEICEDSCIDPSKYFNELTKTCQHRPMAHPPVDDLVQLPHSTKVAPSQNTTTIMAVPEAIPNIVSAGESNILLFVAIAAFLGITFMLAIGLYIALWKHPWNKSAQAPIEDGDTTEPLNRHNQAEQRQPTSSADQQECPALEDTRDPSTHITHANHRGPEELKTV